MSNPRTPSAALDPEARPSDEALAIARELAAEASWCGHLARAVEGLTPAERRVLWGVIRTARGEREAARRAREFVDQWGR